MAQTDKEKQEKKDLIEEMENELNEIENEEGQIDEEKLEEAVEGEENDFGISNDSEENGNYKDILTKTLADFENYKKRVERDKGDMIFFLKSDILKKILPRIDDLERIIKNTPKDLKNNPLYEGITSTFDKLLKDLEKLGVKSFVSIGEEVNPDKHEVVTALPGKEENIIIDEFEKGYMLDDRVLRYAKVVVGMGND